MQGNTRTLPVSYREREDYKPEIEKMMDHNLNDVDDADGRQNPSPSLIIERLLTSGRRELKKKKKNHDLCTRVYR